MQREIHINSEYEHRNKIEQKDDVKRGKIEVTAPQIP